MYTVFTKRHHRILISVSSKLKTTYMPINDKMIHKLCIHTIEYNNEIELLQQENTLGKTQKIESTGM